MRAWRVGITKGCRRGRSRGGRRGPRRGWRGWWRGRRRRAWAGGGRGRGRCSAAAQHWLAYCYSTDRWLSLYRARRRCRRRLRPPRRRSASLADVLVRDLVTKLTTRASGVRPPGGTPRVGAGQHRARYRRQPRGRRPPGQPRPRRAAAVRASPGRQPRRQSAHRRRRARRSAPPRRHRHPRPTPLDGQSAAARRPPERSGRDVAAAWRARPGARQSRPGPAARPGATSSADSCRRPASMATTRSTHACWSWPARSLPKPGSTPTQSASPVGRSTAWSARWRRTWCLVTASSSKTRATSPCSTCCAP